LLILITGGNDFMVIIINSGKTGPTELTWEEKNTDDYSYKAKDISTLENFVKEHKDSKNDKRKKKD